MAGQGRRQRDVGGGAERAAETRGSCRRGGGKGERSKLRVCRTVHLPSSLPHPPGVGWVSGWMAPAPRTDQYLKHREVSSRYFRCPSAAGNEGVKNILQIAHAGIISSLVQVPSIVDEGTDPPAKYFAMEGRAPG